MLLICFWTYALSWDRPKLSYRPWQHPTKSFLDILVSGSNCLYYHTMRDPVSIIYTFSVTKLSQPTIVKSTSWLVLIQTIFTNHSCMPIFLRISSLGTLLSSAFTEMHSRVSFLCSHLSAATCLCFAVKIASVISFHHLKPNCISLTTTFSLILLSNIHSITVIASCNSFIALA